MPGTRHPRDEGASAVEYALLLSSIFVATAAAVLVFGQQVNALFSSAAGI